MVTIVMTAKTLAAIAIQWEHMMSKSGIKIGEASSGTSVFPRLKSINFGQYHGAHININNVEGGKTI